jgi:hypothetical protein
MTASTIVAPAKSAGRLAIERGEVRMDSSRDYGRMPGMRAG